MAAMNRGFSQVGTRAAGVDPKAAVGRAAQQATAAAERMREDAQQLADAHRKAADRRLARHMSAQRVALQKEMRQLQVDQAATMETAAKARRSHIERIRELEAELTQAKAERTNQEVPLEPQTAQTRRRAVVVARPAAAAMFRFLSSYGPSQPLEFRFCTEIRSPALGSRRNSYSTGAPH